MTNFQDFTQVTNGSQCKSGYTLQYIEQQLRRVQ